MSDEQATRPAFEVGQVWRTRGRDLCIILKIEYPFTSYPILTDLYGAHNHYPDGRSCLGEGSEHEDDLIKLISPAPAPLPAPEPVPPAEPWPLPRLFAAPPLRTKLPHGGMIVDAIADDGTAWFMVVRTDPEVVWTDPEIEAPAPYWRQIPPLPQPEAE